MSTDWLWPALLAVVLSVAANLLTRPVERRLSVVSVWVARRRLRRLERELSVLEGAQRQPATIYGQLFVHLFHAVIYSYYALVLTVLTVGFSATQENIARRAAALSTAGVTILTLVQVVLDVAVVSALVMLMFVTDAGLRLARQVAALDVARPRLQTEIASLRARVGNQ